MKRFMNVLFLLFSLSWILIFPTFSNAQRVPPNIWQSADLNYSIMQVPTENSIRIRNILLTEKDGSQNFYRQDFSLRAGNFTATSGTLQREGTNQRPYIIPTRTITIDSSNGDWDGLQPAFDNMNNPSISGDLDIVAVYLAKDNTNLYIMMTLRQVISIFPTINPKTYFFQARLLPENDLASFYTGAVPVESDLGPAFLNIFYRYSLTDPSPAAAGGTANIAQYSGVVGNGTSSLPGGVGFVEWKIPLDQFLVDAIDGRYVDAWTATPGAGPGRIDQTPTIEGVRIVVP